MNGNIPTLFVTGRPCPRPGRRRSWPAGAKGGDQDRVRQAGRPAQPRLHHDLWSVEDPFAEPRIHRAFPGGLEDLEIYRQEVVDGVHDHWIAPQEGQVDVHLPRAAVRLRDRGRSIDQIAADRPTSWPRPATPAGPRPSPGT